MGSARGAGYNPVGLKATDPQKVSHEWRVQFTPLVKRSMPVAQFVVIPAGLRVPYDNQIFDNFLPPTFFVPLGRVGSGWPSSFAARWAILAQLLDIACLTTGWNDVSQGCMTLSAVTNRFSG